MSTNEHDSSRPPTQGDDTHTNAEKKEAGQPKTPADPMADSVFQFDEAPFAMEATETDKPAQAPSSLTDSGRRGSRAPRTMMAGGEGADVLHDVITSGSEAAQVTSPSGNLVQGDSDVLQSAITPAKKDPNAPTPPSSKRLKGDSDEIARQLLNDSGSLTDEESTTEYPSPKAGSESPIEERIVEDSRSEINLTAPPDDPVAPSSGLDLIAEAMESGINLGRTDDFPEGDMLHDDEAASALLDEIHNAPTKADGDSMVDLGAYAALQAMDAEALEREPVSQIMRGAKAASYSEIEVDLENLKTPTEESHEDEVGDLIETATEIKPDAGLDIIEGTVETVTVPAADDEAPAERAPKPGMLPWLGGGALGAILGGGVAALAMGMINPPSKPAGSAPNPAAQPIVAPAPPAPAVDVAVLMRRGDFAQVLPALEKETLTDDEKATKGEAMWLGFLKSRDPKAPLDKNNEEIQKAIKQLQDGGAPIALFWLGQIEEQTGNRDSARKHYEDGLAKAADGIHKSMFQAALDRLEAFGAKVGMSRSLENLPEDRRSAVAQLTMMLTLLQEPSAPQFDEAGFKFWSAVKLARQQKFGEARKLLQEARQTHDIERFRKLRQPQNPLSDPNEEIFLKSVDELLEYWALEEYLKAQNVAPAGTGPLAAVQKLVSEKGSGGGMDAKALFEKLKGDKAVTEAKDPVKAVEQLLAAKNNAVTQAETARKAAEAAQTARAAADEEKQKALAEVKTAQETADTVRKQLTAVGQSLGLKEGDIAKAVEQVVSDRKTLADLVGGLTKAMQDGQVLPANSDRKELIPKVQDLIQQAKTTDKEGIVRRKDEEINRLKTELGSRPSSADLMGFALSSLLSQPAAAIKSEELARSATALAANKDATPEQRGQAYGVMGLTLRRQGKIAEARQALEKAAQADPDNATWKKLAGQLENATAFYIPTVEKALADGRASEALSVATEGVGLFPEDGRLLALRSLAALESARGGKQPVNAEDPRVAAATKDAQAAIAAGAAGQGQFAAGRIAEEQGRLAEAEKLYRQALSALAANDPLSGRCRIALARVLLRNAQPAALGSDRTAQAEPFDDFTRDVLTMVLLVSMQNVQGPGGSSSPQIEEALKLADEAIAAKIPEGYLIKARALSRKGLWTEALQTYAQGLRDVAPKEYADTLALIVERHPAFQRPTASDVPEPQMADRHYANGLRYYFSQRYPEAEKELVEAIKFNDQDARYLYFLGLARLAEGKTDLAYEDFRQGAVLEEKNRPSRFAVSVALERVQGRSRQILNSFRP